jgi:hypothetical protein
VQLVDQRLALLDGQQTVAVLRETGRLLIADPSVTPHQLSWATA